MIRSLRRAYHCGKNAALVKSAVVSLPDGTAEITFKYLATGNPIVSALELVQSQQPGPPLPPTGLAAVGGDGQVSLFAFRHDADRSG